MRIWTLAGTIVQLGSATHIDHRRMLAVLGGDCAAYGEIIRLFLDDLPAQKHKLRVHWDDGGAGELLCDALHSLASASGAVGAFEVERLLRALERQIQLKAPRRPATVREVLNVLRMTASELTALLRRLENGHEC